jgi:hypothetical protein
MGGALPPKLLVKKPCAGAARLPNVDMPETCCEAGKAAVVACELPNAAEGATEVLLDRAPQESTRTASFLRKRKGVSKTNTREQQAGHLPEQLLQKHFKHLREAIGSHARYRYHRKTLQENEEKISPAEKQAGETVDRRGRQELRTSFSRARSTVLSTSDAASDLLPTCTRCLSMNSKKN